MTRDRDEDALRAEIVEYCGRAHRRGFIQSSDGNVSCRLGDEVLFTPSGVNKGFLKPQDIVRTDAEGKPRRAQGRPTGETALHLQVYRLRPEVGAVLHAHPPYAIALSLAGISLAHCVMPEVVFALRSTGIPTAPYAPPVTEDLAAAMADHIRGYHGMILERHGTLTVGRNLEEAYNRLEALEHTARITAIARSLGNTIPLEREEVDRVIGLAGGVGASRYLESCDECGGCGRVHGQAESKRESEVALAGRVAESLARRRG